MDYPSLRPLPTPGALPFRSTKSECVPPPGGPGEHEDSPNEDFGRGWTVGHRVG
jgi:hypothetical protein